MTKIWNTDITTCWWVMQRQETIFIDSWNGIPLWMTVWQVLINFNILLSYNTKFSPYYLPKWTKFCFYETWTERFIATFLTVLPTAKSQKQLICPSTVNDWVNRHCQIVAYNATPNTHALASCKYRNLGCILISERKLPDKTTYCWFQIQDMLGEINWR